MSIFAIGSILFGRFEEHKSRGRRVLKVAIVLGAVLALASTAGRAWAYGFLPSHCWGQPGSTFTAAEERDQRLDR